MDALTIATLSIASIAAIVSAVRMFSQNKSSDKITLIRKDNGKSVTISTSYDKQNSKKLLDLVG
jgi:hypothetical protein